MHYVYLLRSIAHPGERYVGFTGDLRARFKSHNSGASVRTAKYKPWELIAYRGFKDERKARDFTPASLRRRAKYLQARLLRSIIS